MYNFKIKEASGHIVDYSREDITRPMCIKRTECKAAVITPEIAELLNKVQNPLLNSMYKDARKVPYAIDDKEYSIKYCDNYNECINKKLFEKNNVNTIVPNTCPKFCPKLHDIFCKLIKKTADGTSYVYCSNYVNCLSRKIIKGNISKEIVRRPNNCPILKELSNE